MADSVAQNWHDFPDTIVRTRPEWSEPKFVEAKLRSLLDYLIQPEKHAKAILRDTPDTMLICDKFPKAQVHLLLLPKWLPHREIHPHDAFEDPKFLAMIKLELVCALDIAVERLRKCMRKAIIKTAASAMEVDQKLAKRNLHQFFRIGIHAGPSQYELHVHIISRDMYFPKGYSARHYNSFTTGFFVPLDLYPLPVQSRVRRSKFQNNNLHRENLPCWRCGHNFGTDWTALQLHLAEEWQSWLHEEDTGKFGSIAVPGTGLDPQQLSDGSAGNDDPPAPTEHQSSPQDRPRQIKAGSIEEDVSHPVAPE